MADPQDLKGKLEDIVAQLDASIHAVTIAHLNDAIEAMGAIEKGEATRFALHDRLFQGQVARQAVRHKIR